MAKLSCGHCGNPITADDAFCGTCGTFQPQPVLSTLPDLPKAEVPRRAVAPEPSQPGGNGRRRLLMTGLLIFSTLLLAVVIVVGVSVIGGDDDDARSVTSATGGAVTTEATPEVTTTSQATTLTVTATTQATTTTQRRTTSIADEIAALPGSATLPRTPPEFQQLCVGRAEHRIPGPDEDLGTCMRGERVLALQQALRAAGYDVGSVGTDGYYGPITQRAVWLFQYDHGLPPSGNADDATRAALGVT